jgi:hypothetical protein
VAGEPDELELATADANDTQRRLNEREAKYGQLVARCGEREKEIRETTLNGDVEALGPLSAELTTLRAAAKVLEEIGIPELRAAAAEKKAKESEIRRSRAVSRQLEEARRLEGELHAVDSRLAKGFADVIGDLRSRASVYASLVARDLPAAGLARPDEAPRLGLSAADIKVITDGLADFEAMLASERDQARRVDFEATAERNRQRLAAANAPPPLDETPQIVSRWV